MLGACHFEGGGSTAVCERVRAIKGLLAMSLTNRVLTGFADPWNICTGYCCQIFMRATDNSVLEEGVGLSNLDLTGVVVDA